MDDYSSGLDWWCFFLLANLPVSEEDAEGTHGHSILMPSPSKQNGSKARVLERCFKQKEESVPWI